MNKKFLFGIFAGLLLFSTSYGQTEPMKTADRLKMWKDSLNLTSAQLEKLWAIEKEYNPEFDTVKFDGVFDAAKAREHTRQMKIKEVLTEKQQVRLAQMEENERKAQGQTASAQTKANESNGFPSYNTNPLPPDKTGVEHTAIEIAKQMGLGWNLGNSFEAIKYVPDETRDDGVWRRTDAKEYPNESFETAWGNPEVTHLITDGIYKAGFNVLRIPCGWDLYVYDTVNAKIPDFWLARVKKAIDSCLNRHPDMYVMLNIHYDGGWLETNCNPDMQEINNKKQKAYWEQIATYFRDYNDHLLFAACNEPNVHNEVQMKVLASYEQTFVDAVRSTGGKNYYRTLIIQGPSTDIDESKRLFYAMPKDVVEGRLMFEVHYYTPWNFAGMTEDADWGHMFYYWGERNLNPKDPYRCPTYGDLNFMKEHFGMMKEMFVDKGIPVVLGEYACNRKEFSDTLIQRLHNQSRLDWDYEVTKNALEYGMIPVYWDNGAMREPTMGIFNRLNGKAYDQEVVDVIMKAGREAKKYWK